MYQTIDPNTYDRSDVIGGAPRKIDRQPDPAHHGIAALVIVFDLMAPPKVADKGTVVYGIVAV
jgi:hypothetical protein